MTCGRRQQRRLVKLQFWGKCQLANTLPIWPPYATVANCSGERSFSKLEMVEWTKEHHCTKQAEQLDSKDYRAGTSIWYRYYHHSTSIINKFAKEKYRKCIRFAVFDNWLRNIHCVTTLFNYSNDQICWVCKH